MAKDPPAPPVSILSRLATVLIAVTFLVAPFKLCTVLGNSGVPFYPLLPIEWIFTPWPPFLVPGAMAALLVIVLIGNRTALPHGELRYFLLPSVLLAPAALLGFIKTTETDQALLFFYHVLAIPLFVTAVWLQLLQRQARRQIFIICLLIGASFAILSGWQQMLGGFEENERMTMQMAEIYGWELDVRLRDRLTQKRVYGTFTYPNSYAAHLVLTFAFAVACMWMWGKHVEPPGAARALLITLASIFWLTVLVRSQSRGGIVGFAAANGIVAGLGLLAYSDWLKRYRWQALAAVAVFAVAGVGAFFYISKGRDLGSAVMRFHYYGAAVKMFLSAPLTGVGMGEFFPWYLRLKPIDAEETRLVHNLFLHYLSQCGIFGGAAALFFMLQPLLLWRRWRQGKLNVVSPVLFVGMITGNLAWAMHSFLDFNIQTAGTVLTYAALPLLVVDWSRPSATPANRPIWQTVLLLLCCLVAFTSLSRVPGERRYQQMHNLIWGLAPGQSGPQDQPSAVQLLPLVKTIAKDMPHSPYPWDMLGKLAKNQGDLALAEYAFREASRRAPHRGAFHAMQADMLLGMGRPKEAKEPLYQALKWYPLSEKYEIIKQRLEAALAETKE